MKPKDFWAGLWALSCIVCVFISNRILFNYEIAPSIVYFAVISCVVLSVVMLYLLYKKDKDENK